MFGSLLRIFKKSANKPVDPFHAGSYSRPEHRGSAPVESASSHKESAAGSTSHTRKSSEPMVRVSYNAILKHLPRELHGKNSPSSSAKFFMPLAQVLDQLPTGAVKVNFGELRRSAPVGIFRASSDQDVREVDLPLREILPQLTPDAFSRRPQESLQVPGEIADLFGRKGEPLAQLRVLDKKEARKSHEHPNKPTPAPSAIPVEPPPPAPEAPPTPIRMPSFRAPAHLAPAPIQMAPPKPEAPKPAAPAAAPASHHAPPAPHAAPLSPSGGLPEFLMVALRDICQQWPEEINQEISEQNLESCVCRLPLAQMGRVIRNGMVQLSWQQVRSWLQPAPSEPAQGGNRETKLEIPLKLIASLTLSQSQPSFSPTKMGPETKASAKPGHTSKKSAKPPQAEPAPAEPSAQVGPVVQIPLPVLSKNWPARLQSELSTPKLAKTVVEIPRPAIEPGLKAGKIQFHWQQILEWLKPAPPRELGSDDLETICELPLPLLVPLLFPSQAAAAPKRAHAADAIPDLFAVAGRPVEESAPVEEEPQAVSEPAAVEEMPSTPVERKKDPKDLAELFGTPDKRNWTPNEIVHETTRLPDVQGALIALQDGLLVASCMPPSWKTETIAAFLPQIFGRMNQYAKELKMGELNSVTFTVEQGTLQIYNAGIIYFAALAQPGVPLPSCLNVIARELSRHTR